MPLVLPRRSLNLDFVRDGQASGDNYTTELSKLDGLLTFARASTATRFNASGVLETVASGQPRFDFDPVTLACKGLLIEESRTNSLWPSEDISHANYVATGSAKSVATVTNPSGGSTAGLITSAAGAGYHYVSNSTPATAAGVTYASTFMVKKGNQRYVTLADGGDAVWHAATFDFDTETFTQQFNCTARLLKKCSGGWYEIEEVHTQTNAGSAGLQVSFGPLAAPSAAQNYTAAGTETGYWFSGQRETGAFASSYIPTTTAAVTRALETCSITNLVPWFSAAAGTFVFEWLRDNNSGYQSLAHLGGVNYYLSYIATGVNGPTAALPGMTTATYGASCPPGTTPNKVALAYTNAPSVKGSGNGSAVVAPSAAGLNMSAVSSMGLGHNSNSGEHINGRIRRFTYMPYAVSDTLLKALST